MRGLLFAIGLPLAAMSAPVAACEMDYDEEKAFANASVIYIAEVVSLTELNLAIEGFSFWRSQVKPLRAIRGILPRESRNLSVMYAHNGCSYSGDGPGASKRVGALIFVFEGFQQRGDYPRGIHSFGIDAAEKPELLQALSDFSK